MRKVIIYCLGLTCFLQLHVFADSASNEYVSKEYIINHGHSTEMARIIDLQHNQIMGTEAEMDENVHVYRPWQNGVRKFLMYLDPALDDEKFGTHDIKSTVRWDSL